jgi:hypothetical protein
MVTVVCNPFVIYGQGCLGYAGQSNTVEAAMQAQAARGWEFFVCQTCCHWKGGCGCKKNCFIVCTGANTSMCSLYEIERRKENRK